VVTITGIPEDFAGPSITGGPFAGLPAKYFGAILIDPPQRFATFDKAVAVTARGKIEHYRTMPTEAIETLPIADLARRDAMVFCLSTGIQSGPRIGIQKGPHLPTF
jgi:hypothetical protein